MMSIFSIQQPLSAFVQQANQLQEMVELARQKVEFVTAQIGLGN
jgi:hypothetical protein